MENRNDICFLEAKKTSGFIGEYVDHQQVENQIFFIEVNSYLCLKYFLNN